MSATVKENNDTSLQLAGNSLELRAQTGAKPSHTSSKGPGKI
jgi:hypothetical protein